MASGNKILTGSFGEDECSCQLHEIKFLSLYSFGCGVFV